MGKIHVVVDSTSYISDELLTKYSNLHKISLKVRIAEREWNDDELAAADLFAEMKLKGAALQTSQPPVGEFIRVFEQITKAGNEVIVLSVSGALSGTVQGARTAANAVDSRRIHVVDTRTAAVGVVRLAERVLQNIDKGWEMDKILADLNEAVAKTHTLLLVGSLDYLHKGGRIGGAAALFGSILQIKPVLYLKEDGSIAVLDKVRTKKRAVRRLLEEVAKTAPHDYIGVVHVADENDCCELKQQLKELYPNSRISLTEAGAAVAAHTGPGSLAIIYQQSF